MSSASFTDFALQPQIQSTLEEHNFHNPTPVQKETIPVLLQGRDLLATAQTGTGKTLAFAVPVASFLLNNPENVALILVPTRELAQQVLKTFLLLSKKQKLFKTALLIGGAYMRQQCADLSKKPRLIVATPGRLIDHLSRKTLDASKISFVVLDEMDRMLDMGFGEQLKEIFDYVPVEGRQTAMFSATLPHHIVRLAKEYLNNPEQISIGQHSQPVAKIEQEVVFVKQEHKEKELVERLVRHKEASEGSCIIFVKTKIDADRLSEKLKDYGFAVAAMHGDLNQSKRQRVLQDFRVQKISILVATDIAARGIDVAHIRLVVNYELPQAAEDYIHRIGRTARGGAEGQAVSFIAPFEYKKWAEILKLTNPEEAQAFAAKMGRSFGGGSSRHGSGRSSRFEGQSRSGGFSRGGFDKARRPSTGSSWGAPREDRPARNESSWKSERPSNAGSRFASQDGFSARGPRSDRFDNSNRGSRYEGSSRSPSSNDRGHSGSNDRGHFGAASRPGASRDGGFKSDRRPSARGFSDRPAQGSVRSYKVFKGDLVES